MLPVERQQLALVIPSQSGAAAKNLAKPGRGRRFFGLAASAKGNY
jgi:hypothetical protein